MTFATLYAAVFLTLAVGAAPEGDSVKELPVETLLTIEPTEEFPRNSEGDFLLLRDGRLALVYTRFTGGRSDFAAADLCIRTTEDLKTWSDDRVLVPNEGDNNVMSVSLLRTDDDEILLFYLRKNSVADCNLFVRRSNDELKTVSEPLRATVEPGYHVVNNDRVVQLSDGRLIVPAALHPHREGRFSGYGAPRAFFSDDNGKTWQADDTVVSPFPEFPFQFQEPGILERGDGSLWMWMRTDGGSQFACESIDRGKTWTQPKPTSLISPLSPASIERIPETDTVVAVWNDHSGRHEFPEGRRTPLCIAVSNDEGKTWSPSAVIEDDPDGWYCYTAIEFHGDRMLLAYCAGDKVVGGLNRLKVSAVQIDDVLALGRP